ncbi:MAG: biotin--[acetyl-CoA-carboxylase] ligase [Candidatus Cloacimonetes bacterium]|nr:biotin--[acetyl-CoA-carboxylase] ligase [Candidatus Cloacimonadota bacterium]
MKNFSHPFFDDVIYYNKLDSTSKRAEKLIKTNEAHGNFLVIAREQSAGIGRKKNSWFSPKGGIWITAAIYGLSVESNLTIFTGICIHRALIELFPDLENVLRIKWPNDIYLSDKKLCGILSSHLSVIKYHLLGIGINTNVDEFPQELTDIATSLKNELNSEIDNLTILNTLFDIFAEDLPYFIEGNLDVKYFKRNSLLLNKTVELDTDFDKFTGISRGINKQGALLLELKEGMIQPFFAGTVTKF